jgi:UPF0755 protein
VVAEGWSYGPGDGSTDERERRRAERAARRRARADRSRGALADRVKGVLAGDDPPSAGSGGPTRKAEARPPDGRGDVRRRRGFAAVAALVAAIAIVVAVGALVHHLASGGGGSGGGDTTTPVAKPTSQVTIPEGYDRRQIAAVAKQEGIKGDYLKASEAAKGFDPAKYGAQSPQNLEGFLFPATYDMPRHPTAHDLVVRQLAAFKQYIAQVNMGYARSKNLTTYDVLIIASMIEREVQVPKERKLVAAVIYNRLHNGMPLQIDATIRFAENNYTKPLTTTDLQLNSPYNTYTNSSLPPGPIGNPGLASIQAAAHPANVSYLYYVVKPNTCGELTFATTKAQFDRAEAAYNAARAAAGGNAPTPSNCPGA